MVLFGSITPEVSLVSMCRVLIDRISIGLSLRSISSLSSSGELGASLRGEELLFLTARTTIAVLVAVAGLVFNESVRSSMGFVQIMNCSGALRALVSAL